MIRTKWLALIFVLILIFAASAFAEAQLPQEVVDQLMQKHPSHTILLSDTCGTAAAAVLSEGNSRILCLAEEKNGAWTLTVDNASALRKDAEVRSLLLDTDETLFWRYDDDLKSITYHASMENGRWMLCDVMTAETYSNQNTSEYHLTMTDGLLRYCTYFCDENDNLLSENAYEPVPAAWLTELLDLTVLNHETLPLPNDNYTHSWLSNEAFERTAAEFFPNYVFLGGCAEKSHLEFFLQSPEKELVFAVTRCDDQGGWRIVLSTPLPEGTRYGMENFSSSLVIGDLLVSISPTSETTFGITHIYNTANEPDGAVMFSLGRNWVSDEAPNGWNHFYGDHPWDDITMINWHVLPHTLKEAVSQLDTSRWATVNNPNPEDRLHLRTKPDKNAQSLGKYYNGTPVQVLENKGDWVHVDIFGVDGWMMKKYLAFGDRIHSVTAVFPSRAPLESISNHYVYASALPKSPIANIRDLTTCALVLGIVDEDWYHVWFPENDLSGYVLQYDWFEGNG